MGVVEIRYRGIRFRQRSQGDWRPVSPPAHKKRQAARIARMLNIEIDLYMSQTPILDMPAELKDLYYHNHDRFGAEVLRREIGAEIVRAPETGDRDQHPGDVVIPEGVKMPDDIRRTIIDLS